MQAREGFRRWEWPTWLVVVAIYGGWFGLVHYYTVLPWPVSHLGLIVVTAWFMSLQHEVLHGHPTSSAGFNRMLVLFPICPWFPYDLYRDSHLAHHRDELLTLPGIDPESNYLVAEQFEQSSGMGKALHRWRRSVAGRSLLSAPMAVMALWLTSIADPLKGQFKYVTTWLIHWALLALLLWWFNHETGQSPLFWVLTVAYPALVLAMVRSFSEHRVASVVAHRVVINESAWPWRLLYLNNNYHSVHHDHPGMPWYAIEAAFKADREGYLARNGQFKYPGYGYLLWRYGFRPIDSPVHPGPF